MIFAFRNYNTLRPIRMLLVGEIRSKMKAPEPYKADSPYMHYDTRPDHVTVKVVNKEGVKLGQTLYVIEKNPFHSEYRNGLIIGEIVVKSIIHNPFYGWVLTGEGNLLRVREGLFVARTLETENLKRAYIQKKKGDFYRHRGEWDKAVASYNEALRADEGLPEAHAALGSLYLSLAKEGGREDPVRAEAQFRHAYRHRHNFQYESDRLQFYHDYINTLFYRYDKLRYRSHREESALIYLDRILEVGGEVEKMDPGDPENRIHMFRAEYYKTQYYRGRRNAEERNSYDSSLKHTTERLSGMLDTPVSDVRFHLTAALYYRDRLQEMERSPATTINGDVASLYTKPVYELYRAGRSLANGSDPVDRVKSMMVYHMKQYYKYIGSSGETVNPEMDELRSRYL